MKEISCLASPLYVPLNIVVIEVMMQVESDMELRWSKRDNIVRTTKTSQYYKFNNLRSHNT